MSQRTFHLPNYSKPAALLLATLLLVTAAHAQENPTPTNPPVDTTTQPSSTPAQAPVLPNPPGLIRRPQSTGESSSNPQSPNPSPTRAQPTWKIPPSASYLAHAGALCGAGASISPISTKPTGGCGFGMSFIPLPVFIEFGVMGPQANRSNYSGYLSVDGSIPLAPIDTKYLPMAIVGYSRLFETGHAVDYGLALATPRFGKDKNDGSSLRFELRDYWTFANPTQHNIMLRIGWMSIVAD